MHQGYEQFTQEERMKQQLREMDQDDESDQELPYTEAKPSLFGRLLNWISDLRSRLSK